MKYTISFSIAYTASFFVVMNKDVWNSFPADVQKTIVCYVADYKEARTPVWAERCHLGMDTAQLIEGFVE